MPAQVVHRVRASSFGSRGSGDGPPANAARYAGLLATASRQEVSASATSSREGRGMDAPPSDAGRLTVLEGELRELRQQATELTRVIGEKNDAYIRREEELCDRISELNKNASQREKAAPSVAEQRILAERFRRASQLQEDIVRAEARLADGEQERVLAETAVRRLEQHIKATEDASGPLAHALEELVTTMRSVCRDALATTTAAVATVGGVDDTISHDGGANGHPANPVSSGPVSSGKGSPLPPPATHREIDPPQLLQDAVVGRVPAAFRERCALQVATRVIAGHVGWFAQQLGRLLAEEGASQAKRASDVMAQHQAAREKMTANASLLEASQDVLLRTHHDLLERREHLDQRTQLLSSLEEQLAQVRAAVPLSLQQIGSVERAMVKIEGELTSLSIEAAREAERVALQQTETSLAAARAQQSQSALDEATDVLEQRKRALKELEQEKSDLTRKLFLLEEAKATGEQRVGRLSAELSSTQESLQTAEARLASVSADDEASVKAWRVLERELDGLRALRESAHHRYDAKALEKARLEDDHRKLREERSQLRQQILDVQGTLTASLTKEQETIQELQYVQRLLPKNHPSAKLSRKLQARLLLLHKGSGDHEEEDQLTTIAVAKRSELLDSARKSFLQRMGGAARSDVGIHRPAINDVLPSPAQHQALDFDEPREGQPHAASRPLAAAAWPPSGGIADHPLSSEPLLQHSSTISYLDNPTSREISSSVQSATSSSRGASAYGLERVLARERQELDQRHERKPTGGAAPVSPSLPPAPRRHDDVQPVGARPVNADQQQADQRSISGTSSSTHTSSIAEINEKLNEIMNRRRR